MTARAPYKDRNTEFQHQMQPMLSGRALVQIGRRVEHEATEEDTLAQRRRDVHEVILDGFQAQRLRNAIVERNVPRKFQRRDVYLTGTISDTSLFRKAKM